MKKLLQDSFNATFIILILMRFYFSLLTTITKVYGRISTKTLLFPFALLMRDVGFSIIWHPRSQLTCWWQRRLIASHRSATVTQEWSIPAALHRHHEQHTVLQSLQWWKLQKLAENNGESLHTEEPHSGLHRKGNRNLSQLSSKQTSSQWTDLYAIVQTYE